jgi:hypothetical protein
LTRSYESNGPDVKIRGSAQQIAEKYTALARDAQGAGDRVMAENYLQHAEHYNRIIAAAQSQLQIQTQRDYRDEYDDEDESDMAPVQERRAQPPAPEGNGPQPVISGVPAEVALTEPVTSVANAGAEGAEAELAEGQAEQPKPSRRVRRPRKTAKSSDGADQPASEAGDAASDPDSQLAAAGG